LAKIKNFKVKKETIAIAKTLGHRKKRKVIRAVYNCKNITLCIQRVQ